jgi:hypothetical protein
LRSRSRDVPHDAHVQKRSERASVSFRAAHEEHSLELGYRRATTITLEPAIAAFYSSWRRNSKKPRSPIARERQRLASIPETLRSSIAIVR